MTAPADRVDVLVVGGGPAGLAAAAAAAETGATVALVDAGPGPGGQYWRNAEQGSGAGLHHDRDRFVALLRRIRAAAVVCLVEHTVQTVAADADGWVVHCVVGREPRAGGGAAVVRGRRLVLAPGAYDRQLPFPGWDLPGVLAAGGVQALLKQHGVAAGRRAVVAGTGPFLLPVADGLLRSGATVAAVVEANSPAGFVRHPRAVLGARGKLGEAAGYLLRLARTRTRYRRRSVVVRALGTDQLEAVEVARLDRAGRPVPGGVSTVPCDLLAVGWGFTPHLELHLQLGCATELGADGSLVVTADDAGRTSVPGVWAAGECTGIGGSELAVVEGEIAGRSAVDAGVPARLLRRRAALRRFAAALHAVHPVPPEVLDALPDETLLCRCEEVPVGAVRDAVGEWGATDARTVKLLTRTGMGWCQGRVCGSATALLTARACGRECEVADLRAFAERPLTVPLPLRVLAD
ncbi:NAD(P)/FAD-dependent oxidoreductase [Modestobacter versicolor]|uniref:FAD/NAD(P)-dependent oxidoreductase n=1 Tax=Modestobacter versicolor TaxID=429133 RepID=UPI0034DFA228